MLGSDFIKACRHFYEFLDKFIGVAFLGIEKGKEDGVTLENFIEEDFGANSIDIRAKFDGVNAAASDVVGREFIREVKVFEGNYSFFAAG
jgi:hypothetical protein